MDRRTDRATVAITMGDPAGVGPEILAKAVGRPAVRKLVDLVVVGDLNAISRAAAIVAPGLEFRSVDPENVDFRGLLSTPDEGDPWVPVVDLANVDRTTFRYGELRAEYGEAAYTSLLTAIDLAMARTVDAVVTTPLNKEALHMAGHLYGGHTEILAERTGTSNYTMMLAHGSFRAVHLSTHVSLRQACDLVTTDRVLRVIQLTHETLRRLCDAQPRIAVAGLNPHAGEHGLFGSEDSEQILPAVEKAQSDGINVVGPLPADTLFPQAASGAFDALVVMYHDQGHIPLKLAGFTHEEGAGFSSVHGVNITLGLPIIRTSVDHGTAFDIAGTGVASDESLVEAIEYAVMLAGGQKLADGRPATLPPRSEP